MQPEQSGPLTMEYDVEKAVQLMDAAGYSDGFESDFYGTSGFFALTDPGRPLRPAVPGSGRHPH